MLLSRLSVVVIKKKVGPCYISSSSWEKKSTIKPLSRGLGGNSYTCMQPLSGGGGLGERVLYNLGHKQSTIYIHYVSMKIVKFLISLLISIMINQKHVSVTYSFLQKLKIQIEKKTSRIYYLLNLKCLKISMLTHKFNEM